MQHYKSWMHIDATPMGRAKILGKQKDKPETAARTTDAHQASVSNDERIMQQDKDAWTKDSCPDNERQQATKN